MDDADRRAREATLHAQLDRLFSAQATALADAESAPSWAAWSVDVHDTLRRNLEFTAAESALLLYLLLLPYRKPSDGLGRLAFTWAGQRASEVSRGLVTNVQAQVEEARRAAAAAGEALDRATARGILSEARALAIAITETTAAHTAGRELAAREANRDADEPLPDGTDPPRTRPPGVPLVSAYWVTMRDQRVCNFCEPLHGTERKVWSRVAPNGPPAHQRCRCYVAYQNNEDGTWEPQPPDDDPSRNFDTGVMHEPTALSGPDPLQERPPANSPLYPAWLARQRGRRPRR